jgi:hypothetical protein
MDNNESTRRLKAVSNALQDLQQQLVFVGGSTVSLYSDRGQTITPRFTKDVDAIIEVIGYGEHPDVVREEILI